MVAKRALCCLWASGQAVRRQTRLPASEQNQYDGNGRWMKKRKLKVPARLNAPDREGTSLLPTRSAEKGGSYSVRRDYEPY